MNRNTRVGLMVVLGPIVLGLVVGVPAFLAYATYLHAVTVRVASGSMEPTLMIGDVPQYRSYADGESPALGDLIVFQYPLDTSIRYVKRVVALGGDRIRVDGNRLVLNGVAVPAVDVGKASFVDENCETNSKVRLSETLGGSTHELFINIGSSGPMADMREIVVPAGSVFVMGDNRDNSEDSRRYKSVPLERVIGKIETVRVSYDPCKGGARRSERNDLPVD